MAAQLPGFCDAARSDHARDVLRKYWGYDSFLPLQEEAIGCVLEGHDSVVVLPTGGGKSLCYQVPAMCLGGLAVVVSPLISLMKDQVDTLRSCGVPAACINSSLSREEKANVARQVRDGKLRLLYVAPERLVLPRTLEFLSEANLSFVAVDEAHCVSSWGHDFRPEYRALRILKETFPNVGIHAYTATASQQVREDIAEQLSLDEPNYLVGSFDRPNLTYRVQRRHRALEQIVDVINRHPKESGIVYCISRNEVERTAAALSERGHRALPYHAGLSDEDRQRNQEAFIEEQTDIIVATVAFGMGIDKPNVRYVVHSGMPKSLEHYQQESGRAGRDGLEAECCLFFSGNDFRLWKDLLGELEPEVRESSFRSLSAMYDFCGGVTCRHRAIVRYFGQDLEEPQCGACDVCLGELELAPEPLVTGQKILSCVARLNQGFGGGYTAQVLAGSQEQRILANGHDQLSTYGLLQDAGQRAIRDWIEQLVAQGFLEKYGEFNLIKLTDEGMKLLRGEVTPRLLKPRPARSEKSRSSKGSAAASESQETQDAWEGVDRGLFDALRDLRRELAVEQNVPAYVVFGDGALRDMARRRPSNLDKFLEVKGVGAKKCKDYGNVFLEEIGQYCDAHGLDLDAVE